MVHPATALLIFALLASLLAILLWPRRGVAVRLLRLLRMTERVRLEDALKHLYHCEYDSREGSVESLAGALEISRALAVRLVSRLEALELIRSDGHGLPLTESGREYALRIVRIHRLWERYLADRTNVSPVDWHEEAERREHTMAPAEAEELAAKMGFPVYDPHGDPIPTADGELPLSAGVALTALKEGQKGTIVHLEDEPREVFEQLVAAKLAPLMQLELLEASPEVVRFTADGESHELEPVAATNITVLPIAAPAADVGPFERLTDLRPGEGATVVHIAPTCQGPQRRRLLDLGLVPGTEVEAELEGALKEPVAYRIRGALIALRRQQTDLVYVKKRGAGQAEAV
ncbi:MAG: metal-dependent transcriptional regulator [Gemmatimonadota bacterium]|nr:MAG: metal-dependent transcriptional regulator [Gemmatimonadota bacterium]